MLSRAPAGKTKNPPDDSAQNTWGLGGSCRVHKPGVPRGPASTPGLGPRKQHVVHGPAQKSKTQRAGQDSPVTDRKDYPKEQALARQILRPASPTRALASGTSRLRAVSPIERPSPKHCFLLRARVSDRGSIGSLLAALLRLARLRPTGAIRPGRQLGRNQGRTEKAAHKSNHDTRDHTLYACGNSAPQPP